MSAATLYTLAGVPLHMDADNIQSNWPVFLQMFLARAARLGQFEYTGGLLASVLPDTEYLGMFAVLLDTVVPDNPGRSKHRLAQRPNHPLPHVLRES
jgi:hypothetical protein